jgi:2-phospho-L-lactate transferase/gluconeogenesis factor (CofD/UPF0052 family)
VLDVVRQVFLHRFGAAAPTAAELRDPVRVLPPGLRKACPPALRAALAGLTAGLAPWLAARLRVPGHSFGNLLLTAAMFRGIRAPRAPTLAEVERGLAAVARAIGAPPGRVHAATAAPGTLIYEYANGVWPRGRRARRARGAAAPCSACDRLRRTGARLSELLRRLRQADLIVYSPGSLYSSIAGA